MDRNNKPYRGEIEDWYRHYFDATAAEKVFNEKPGLGYVIRGFRYGRIYQTSWVVSEDNGCVETRNSYYKLEGPSREEIRHSGKP